MYWDVVGRESRKPVRFTPLPADPPGLHSQSDISPDPLLWVKLLS